MGDLKEFTTKGNLEAVFHKVTTGAVRFSLKRINENCYPNAVPGCAAVILSTTPTFDRAYWIVIEKGGNCHFDKDCECLCKVSNSNFILGDEYKDFWISWNNGAIRLGYSTDTKPTLVSGISEKNLFYVAFVALNIGSQLKWKIRMAPHIEQPVIVKLSGGEPQWVTPGDRLPDDAIIGGYEREILYIMRAKHQGSLTPGKYVPSQGVGYISWGDYAHLKQDFEILCGYNFMWVPTTRDNIPFGAVIGGYDRHENLYVCRRKCGDSVVVPGKVTALYKMCLVPFQGREVHYRTYDILIVPNDNSHGEDSSTISNFVLPCRPDGDVGGEDYGPEDNSDVEHEFNEHDDEDDGNNFWEP